MKEISSIKVSLSIVHIEEDHYSTGEMSSVSSSNTGVSEHDGQPPALTTSSDTRLPLSTNSRNHPLSNQAKPSEMSSVRSSATDGLPPEPAKRIVPYKFTYGNYGRRCTYKPIFMPESTADMTDVWYSRPFYSHPSGYKMCVGVAAQGVLTSMSESTSSHLAICVCLMKGEYDNSLKWPFRGEVIIQLLNHLDDDGGHHEDRIVFDERKPSICCER